MNEEKRIASKYFDDPLDYNEFILNEDDGEMTNAEFEAYYQRVKALHDLGREAAQTAINNYKEA